MTSLKLKELQTNTHDYVCLVHYRTGTKVQVLNVLCQLASEWDAQTASPGGNDIFSLVI